ncbi:baseplate J/gp47 family protein [Collimonas sp. OK412]|jgi:phage-related baseplate assembly protein|uniref:baseplate assembly protein n=1 Tax=Collimonas sp. (strain OK412) TaxID=1801619 RepID=UPI0008EEA916|nr:baseplate J/gp47 family protein [Collimonas sp. OK412]SFD28482.1 Phage-related baseplate assembly protein [Collimonas sp. OK412]
MSGIDLSRLPAPNVIEPLDFETILAEQLADLQERDAEFVGLQESDPAMKVLQVTAYRELKVRQRINEAARAVMLAYALDADLDHLGALMDVPRLQIWPADPDKGIAAVMEENEDYRRRIQLAPQGLSVAGPEGAYVFHALSSDGRVRNATATSPAPGHVVVTILSHEGDGTPSQELLDIVAAHLAQDGIRPLTDYVLVRAAQIERYQVKAVLYSFSGPDSTVVVAEADKRMRQYAKDAHQLGRVPTHSGVEAALHVPGVERVTLITPTDDPDISKLRAHYCDDIALTYGGVHE